MLMKNDAVFCDVYNFKIDGDKSCCLTANSGVPNAAGPKLLILNDQGGSVMDVSENVSACLRAQEHGHQPVVCYTVDHVVTTGGNCTAQGPCWYKDICPTEKASGVHAVCYEVNNGRG